jgi:hypothetical protein
MTGRTTTMIERLELLRLYQGYKSSDICDMLNIDVPGLRYWWKQSDGAYALSKGVLLGTGKPFSGSTFRGVGRVGKKVTRPCLDIEQVLSTHRDWLEQSPLVLNCDYTVAQVALMHRDGGWTHQTDQWPLRTAMRPVNLALSLFDAQVAPRQNYHVRSQITPALNTGDPAAKISSLVADFKYAMTISGVPVSALAGVSDLPFQLMPMIEKAREAIIEQTSMKIEVISGLIDELRRELSAITKQQVRPMAHCFAEQIAAMRQQAGFPLPEESYGINGWQI